MTYITTATQARIQAKITAKEAQKAILEAAYIEAAANSEISAYEFDAGEGRQKASRRNPALIRAEITAVDQELETLYRRQEGRGIVNLRVAR